MVRLRYAYHVITILGLLAAFATACEGVEEGGIDPEMASSLGGDEAKPWLVTLPWEQVDTGVPLKVLSSGTFKTGSGEYVYLVCEAENTGDVNLTNVKVTVKAHSDAGQVLDERTLNGLLDIVPPGGKVPFSKAIDARDVVKYELLVEGEPTDEQPRGNLEIVSEEMAEPKQGYVWISGEVQNTDDVGATSVEVIAVLYDEEGSVVDAVAGTVKETIPPGETKAFRFMANYRGVSSYELYVQGQDEE
jgi:hypothetical protein